MKLPTPVAARLALTAALLLLALPALARDLTVLLPDDIRPTAMQEVYLHGFATADGIAPVIEIFTGSADALRTRLAGGDADVTLLPGAVLAPFCEAGLLDKLDWPALGGKDRLLALGAAECGLGAGLRATVLAWDRDKLQGMPGWGDFWDVVKAPGRRGLQRGPRGNLEIALLADGVQLGDVYRLLRTDAGLERAFRKLDQLKPYLVWWRDAADAALLLGSGDVLMTSAPHAAVAQANRQGGRNFGEQWTGAIDASVFWAIVHGTPNASAVQAFLIHAADQQVQARLLEYAYFGPLVRGANDGLPPDLLAQSPSAPAALAASLQVDEAFWRDNQARLGTRFDAWLGN